MTDPGTKPRAEALYVFDAGRWLATPPGERDPLEVPSPLALAPLPDEVPDQAAWLHPGVPRVLRANGDSIEVWDAERGAIATLDGIDATILEAAAPGPDGAPRPLPIGPAAAHRIQRLASLGLVAPAFGGMPEPPPEPGPAPAALGDDAPADPAAEALADLPHRSATEQREAAWRTVARRGAALLRKGADAASRAPDEAGPAPEPAPLAAEALDPRTRVLASWDIPLWGQPLALGCLLAYARVHRDGVLDHAYDLRPLLDHEQLLAELDRDDRPAVVLLSDYIWSAARNHEVAAEVKARSPHHLVIHGGPHVPKYAEDKRAFFLKHPAIDVIAHGEGEITLAEALEALGGDPAALERLHGVPGLTVRAGEGLVDTVDRPRHDQLADFPSPYLTGEFDHLDPSGWMWPSIETNRGCPYSCTFCDWGSATRSRIRDFPIERVMAELDWLAERGLPHWMIDDANFGIHRRDVDIARRVVELKAQHGVPSALYVNYAKNTVKHLAVIIGMLTEAGITGEGALALQTRDPETLKAIKRANIRTDKYDELAEEFRRYGLPLVTDLIIGMPGQTVRSLLADMQYCFDNEVTPRFFVALNLPNAEFNDPEYRDRFRIVLGDGDVVVETSSFTREDRARMMRLRMAFRCFEHFGILRQVLHLLQWDHGVPASETIDRLEARVHADPDRYPLSSWVLGYLDVLLIPPFGWRPYYEEARQLVIDEFPEVDQDALDVVLAVQEAIMPAPGRSFPHRVALRHDYGAWYASHKAREATARPLRDHDPAEFEVVGDPTFRCSLTMGRMVDERPHELVTTAFWAAHNWELDSPLQRLVPENAVSEAAKRRAAEHDEHDSPADVPA